jgi:transcription-repair coupling factor (superfamily II helicase)
VDNGYQVAVLVPTTILAEQHYHTFRERIAEFPFHIAKLSRFCSAKEQRETLKKLELGEVDIVIGTHRLASTDVKFHNLGLLIIDEEQRFGVEVKERLKSMRSMVDVLTMTATPIPRTLHMSMTGLRDISNLETPPDDRIAVETRLARWNDDLIRHAIVRELDRGGQVYFVHNRVNDIEVVKKKLQRIVPEALIQVGHGQMHEQELEQVMVEFVQGKFDVLLATTIVESGLDIPNANTIFVDESHRYGLADLHQLRGRVGRYRHRAYCYLLIDKHKHITPDAARRLRAIEEFSHMGAGFAIAMRDLEFRGAGNVLGTQQSGHISAVGYELYCQMLENAVRHLRRLPPQISLDTNVDLPCQAYLPVEYVPEQRARIDLYRRLTRVSSPADLETLVEELQDRFGAIPEPANHLIQIASLRMDAAVWRIATIRLENNFLVFDYTDKSRITQLSKLHQRKLRIVDDRSAYWPLNQLPENPDQILKLVQSVLRP